MVISDQVVNQCVTPCPIARPVIPVHGHHGLTIKHDPGVGIVVLCAQYVGCEQIGSIDLTHKVGGEDVERVAQVKEHLVVGNDGLLPHRTQGRASTGRKCNGRGQNCRLT